LHGVHLSCSSTSSCPFVLPAPQAGTFERLSGTETAQSVAEAHLGTSVALDVPPPKLAVQV
jgi:hypothetical protein